MSEPTNETTAGPGDILELGTRRPRLFDVERVRIQYGDGDPVVAIGDGDEQRVVPHVNRFQLEQQAGPGAIATLALWMLEPAQRQQVETTATVVDIPTLTQRLHALSVRVAASDRLATMLAEEAVHMALTALGHGNTSREHGKVDGWVSNARLKLRALGGNIPADTPTAALITRALLLCEESHEICAARGGTADDPDTSLHAEMADVLYSLAREVTERVQGTVMVADAPADATSDTNQPAPPLPVSGGVVFGETEGAQ